MVENIILTLNAVGALIFFFLYLRKGQKAFLALFFLALPVLGFVLYFVVLGMGRIRNRKIYDRDSLVGRSNVEKSLLRPDMEKELDIVPVEDAMAVESNEEKRKFFLNELKKDLYRNYREILPAGRDRDSESAHYVASARMEVYRNLYDKIREGVEEYSKDSKSAEKLSSLLFRIADLANSGLLSKGENEIYKKKYCDIFAMTSESLKKQFEWREFEQQIIFLVDLKRFEEAEHVWKKMAKGNRTEKGYARMLELYYEQKDRQEFHRVLDELRGSGIVLSPDGMNMVRFWLAERT